MHCSQSDRQTKPCSSFGILPGMAHSDQRDRNSARRRPSENQCVLNAKSRSEDLYAVTIWECPENFLQNED